MQLAFLKLYKLATNRFNKPTNILKHVRDTCDF